VGGSYNPGITTDINPLYYNTGNNFTTSPWATLQPITNQFSIISQIPSYTNLPAVAAPHHVTTTLAMSSYLLSKRNSYQATSYGSITLTQVDTTAHSFGYIIFANYTALHAAPLYTNIINQAILRSYPSGASTTITISMHPLPTPKTNTMTAGTTTSAFNTAMFTLLALCLLPSAFILFVVREKELKAKNQQVISGVSFLAYWTSTFLFDVLSYQVGDVRVHEKEKDRSGGGSGGGGSVVRSII